MEIMKKHRAGIIGCGGIANNKHLPALQKQADRIETVAFCDLDLSRAKALAARIGAENAAFYTDYRQLLANETLDVVYVLTPNRWHAEMTIVALEAGKHVFCEKPMACTAAEAKAMCEAAERAGRLLTIGYQYRCEPAALKLKTIVEAGALGDVYYAEARAIRRRGVPNWGVFLNKEEQGGGALIDIGTHALDMTLWLMNNYRMKMVVGKAFQKLGRLASDGNKFGAWDVEAFGQVDDSAFGFIVMEDGAVISLGASWALNTLDTREQKVTLCGTAAGADMNDGLTVNGVAYGGLYETRPSLVPDRAHADETAADREAMNWLDAIEGKAALRVLPEQARVVTEILEAVYAASCTGEAVYFS